MINHEHNPKANQFRLASVALVALPIFVLLTGCSGSKQSPEGPSIVIGSVIPLSGPNAHYGEDDKQGIEIAKDEVNQEGIVAKGTDGNSRRYTLQLQYENSFGGPNNTQNAPEQMTKLANAGILAVVGAHFSGEALQLAPIANERHVVLVTPTATNYKLRQAGPWVFRMLPNDYDQAVEMARYGRNRLKASRAAVLYIDNDYGADIAKVFVETLTADGGAVVYNRKFGEGQREFGGFITDLLKSKAEFLFLVGHTQEMADLLRTKGRIERGEGGKHMPVLGTDGMYDDTFIQQAGDTAEGIVLASAGFNPQSNDPAVKKFVAAFQARYNKAPNLWSASSYDSVHLIVEAIRRGGISADAIRTNLHQIQNYPGATGPNSFDETGGIVGKSVFTFVVRQGKFEQLQ